MAAAKENQAMMFPRIWLVALLWLRRQQLTAREEDLSRRLADADRRIKDLMLENERQDGALRIRDEEIKLLTALNARNQARIEAETAEAARRIALAGAKDDHPRLAGGFGT